MENLVSLNLEQLVKENPNDMELGKVVREIYITLKKENETIGVEEKNS